MAFMRKLPSFFATTLIITLHLIANADGSYTCSKKTTKNLPDQNEQTENGSIPASYWPMPLNITRLLPSQPRNESYQNLVFIYPLEKQCSRKILFLPVRPRGLIFPNVEVLPNQQVCLNGRLLQNKCMPKDPVAFPFMINGIFGSLIVSASYYSSK